MDRTLRAFGDVVRGPEREIDLGLGALLVAQVECPDLVPEHHLKRLDELAARSGAGGVPDALRALHRLREFLFAEEGFRGNVEDYYDPRNSCLNEVLQRRLGIPITLAVVVIEVGRRLGLRIVGTGLPGHFLVTAEVGGDRLLLDPFHGGTVITPERAAELAARALGRRVRLIDTHFAPVGKRHILARMLANLRGIYSRNGDWPKTLAVVERLLLLDEGCAPHVRDRGTLRVKLGRLHEGVSDWERYLRQNPEAKDAEALKQQLRRVRQRLGAMN